MPKYLLSIYQPEGKIEIAADLHRFNEELRDSGSWMATNAARRISKTRHQQLQ